MVNRLISDKIKDLLGKFPVVTLTGARQCGKSTLLKNLLPDYRYVSLEDPDMRRAVSGDPRSFLDNFSDKTIIDEAQYVPELFSYIQTKVDDMNRPGMYVLSGSHNFLLMESVTQSLAGRVAILKLAPFSISELRSAGMLPDNSSDLILNGGYPRVYDWKISPEDYYPNYVMTYLERDVRLLRNVNDFSRFELFLRLCASRVGQQISFTALSNECGISVQTAKDWISILESSYLVFRLSPYYKNFGKRLVKTPKLYFYDTGLVCSLLGLQTSSQMMFSDIKGALFENLVIADMLKKSFFAGKQPQLYYWRDSNGNEVDLLEENGGQLNAYEIKSGSSLRLDWFKGLDGFAALSGIDASGKSVIYAGDFNYLTESGKFVSWKEL